MSGTRQEGGPAPFVSYSANAEDVLLHRLFRDVEPSFFVDVGAAHPRNENDTFALYQVGWRGINVEPNPDFFAALVSERPEDRNYQLALSDTDGEDSWFEVVGTGLSTMSQDMADEHRVRGHEVRQHRVKVTTLAALLSSVPIDRRFRLLKVDVEGFEEKVLRGNDWSRFKPDVILLEATLPESTVRRVDGIADLLREQGYKYVYFDGLNDYYLVDGYDVGEAFATPPNIFDHAVPDTLLVAREAAQKAEDYAMSLEANLSEANFYSKSLAEHFAEAQRYAKSLEERVRSSDEAAGVLEARLDAASTEIQAKAELIARLEGETISLQNASRLASRSAATWEREALALRTLLERSLTNRRLSVADLVTLMGPGAGDNQLQEDSTVTEPTSPDGNLASAAEKPVQDGTALALLTAKATVLEAEVRRLRHDAADAAHQSKRLKDAASQLRVENLQLMRFLDADSRSSRAAVPDLSSALAEMSAMLTSSGVESAVLRRELEAEKGRSATLTAELTAAQAKVTELNSWLTSIASSMSWKVSAPYRVIGRKIKYYLKR